MFDLSEDYPQSLEVVNKLSNLIKLPEAFLHIYLTKCIQYCEELQVHFGSCTHQNPNQIYPKKMFTEIQEFCIEFSKIPAVSQLFKLLKETGYKKIDP